MGRQKITPKFPKEFFQYFLVLFIFLLVLLYLIFFTKLKLYNIEKILLFIAIGIFSRLPQRMSPFSFGIELITLVTISSAILYGRVVGSLVGVLCFLISGFYTRERPQDVLIAAVGMALIGYLTLFFYPHFSIGATALFLTFLYDIFTGIFYVVSGHSTFGCLRFSLIHIPSNYLIIRYLGPKLLGL